MPTKHREVYDYLERFILSGEIAEGDSLPGEFDLSRILSVSRNTVRHAIKELSQKYRIERTPGRGSVFLGEIDAPPATKSIGIINSSLIYTIYPEMIHGIEDGLYRSGYSMLLANGNYDPEKEIESAKRMLSNGVSGFIIEPTNSSYLTADSEIVRALNGSGVPVLTTNCVIDGLNASYITIDDYLIGREAAEHLIAQGHRRIAYIYKQDTQAGEIRYRGYADALVNAGLEVDSGLVRFYTQDAEDLVPGEWYTREILDEYTDTESGPTAFIYFNDQLALQAYAVFAERGLNVPGDISVVGIDNIPESMRAKPRLTTFNHPKYLMGKLAVEMILSRLGSHDDRFNHGVTMKAQMVERNSVKKVG